MADFSPKITENLARIRDKVAEAAAKSGRPSDAVTLVAVTKYASLDDVRSLVAAGCHDLGESRPKQLWERAELLNDPAIRWHFIGHLQRNKVHRTLPHIAMVHSIDSQRLLDAIEAEPLTLPMPVLLEVNVSGDAAKQGFLPGALEPWLASLSRYVPRTVDIARNFTSREKSDMSNRVRYKNIAIRGLMCMAGLQSDADATRREFASLRTLRDRLQPNCPPYVELSELSMGMSGDYEIAIEEGATMVRVGSALFE
jgi:PLP dependent protein